MSIGNSAYIQDLSDGLWGSYISGEASNLMRDSKWRGVEQLGLGLTRAALQTYVNPALAPKTYAPPVTTKIQPSLKFTPDLGPNLAAKWQPQIDQNTLKLSLLESSSSNPLTKMQGQNRFNNLMNDQQARFDNMISETTQVKPLSGSQQALAGGAGALAGMGVSMGINALGNKMFGDSQGGQFATQVMSQGAGTIAGSVGSTVAGNVASGASAGANVGSNLASLASNAGALTSLGAGIANVGLDVFDPMKKSKWESGVNVGLGLASLIPGVGPFAALGALAFNGIGHAFGQKTESFTANTDLLGQTNGSYGGSVGKIMTAQQLANTKHSLWDNSGRHKDDEKIFEAQRQQNTINNVIGYNNDRRDIAQSNSGILHTGREVELAGGYNLTGTRAGKKGMVINKRTEISLTLPTKEFKEGGSLDKEPTFIELVNPVDEFQQGGSINVIPDGALHARKHNMDLEGVTPKGIPVVSEKEGGEVEQQAEIEKEEIIFRLEVTKKLEELAKDGSSDAAIEAGKLLVDEILYNTIDKTNNLL